ncbi:hypothetical protein D3C78_1655490 [compost metagenome]
MSTRSSWSAKRSVGSTSTARGALAEPSESALRLRALTEEGKAARATTLLASSESCSIGFCSCATSSA